MHLSYRWGVLFFCRLLSSFPPVPVMSILWCLYKNCCRFFYICNSIFCFFCSHISQLPCFHVPWYNVTHLILRLQCTKLSCIIPISCWLQVYNNMIFLSAYTVLHLVCLILL
jgi:hypothetical protein